MDNKKIASQVIRALHKPTASTGGGGGGGEVWRELDFTETTRGSNPTSSHVDYQVAELTKKDYVRATITLVVDSIGSARTFRTNAFAENISTYVALSFKDIHSCISSVYNHEFILSINREITETDTFKLEKIEILEQ